LQSPEKFPVGQVETVVCANADGTKER
jgi:hypothetical protein